MLTDLPVLTSRITLASHAYYSSQVSECNVRFMNYDEKNCDEKKNPYKLNVELLPFICFIAGPNASLWTPSSPTYTHTPLHWGLQLFGVKWKLRKQEGTVCVCFRCTESSLRIPRNKCQVDGFVHRDDPVVNDLSASQTSPRSIPHYSFFFFLVVNSTWAFRVILTAGKTSDSHQIQWVRSAKTWEACWFGPVWQEN